jgi:RimJ/RimL family protein N-acetyltransferase/GNAT superfamily N-acetyltransferase
MEITGKKTILRDTVPADLVDYQRWFASGSPWQEWDGPWERADNWREKAMDSIARLIATKPPDQRSRLEIDTLDGRHIGWVNSYWVSEVCRWRDCGIVIAEDYWEQGFGTDAFRLFVDYLLCTFDLPRIGMGTWSGNERMIRCAGGIGFREEACFRDARLVKGERYDAVRWGITRSEWNEINRPPVDGLRRFLPDDRGAVVELTRQLYNHHRSLQSAPEFTAVDAKESVREWLGKRETVAWVWQQNGVVIGFARARRSGVCFFEELVIDRQFRGQGIGSSMLQALESELIAAGETDIFLSMVWPGNGGAVDFYIRHGYDLLNTFELRKGFTEDRRGERIQFLDRPFHVGKNVNYH